MGCHTWTYDKVETFEEMLERKNIDLRKVLDDELDWAKTRYFRAQEIQDAELYDYEIYYRYIKRLHHFYNKGCLRKSSRFKDFMFDIIEKQGYIPEYDLFKAGNMHNCIDGIIYKEISEYHNVFRIYQYDLKLNSLEECFEAIDNCDSDKLFVDVVRLKEFWNKYPNGLITTG